jgi:aquaglyceroporin related protein
MGVSSLLHCLSIGGSYLLRVGIMLGAYTASPSGGHLNPAVTLSMCIYRRFPWKQFPVYALSQTLGAFCAAGVVYGNYKSAIDAYEGVGVRTVTGFSNHSTSGIFSTSPAPFMTTTGAFFSEFLASAVLMFCIFALSAEKYGSKNLTPLILAFVFIGISACFGWETGFAINMARDFGPRLMVSCLGYGGKVWSANNYYFWVRESCRTYYQHWTNLCVGAYRSPIPRVCFWGLAIRRLLERR